MTSSTAKDTDSEDDQRSPPTEADSKASTSGAVKAEHKLGMIGIRSKNHLQNDTEEEISAHKSILDDTSGQTESPFKKDKHKLGKIGGKARRAESRDKSKDPPIQATPSPLDTNESLSKSEHTNTGQILPKREQGSPTVQKSLVQNIEETPWKISNMQANENRERLKRELDAKGNNTTRKKRKF